MVFSRLWRKDLQLSPDTPVTHQDMKKRFQPHSYDSFMSSFVYIHVEYTVDFIIEILHLDFFMTLLSTL